MIESFSKHNRLVPIPIKKLKGKYRYREITVGRSTAAIFRNPILKFGLSYQIYICETSPNGMWLALEKNKRPLKAIAFAGGYRYFGNGRYWEPDRISSKIVSDP